MNREKELKDFLESEFIKEITNLKKIRSGNIKESYYFDSENESFILTLSNEPIPEFKLNNLLKDKVNFKRLLRSGMFKGKFYQITNKIKGESLRDLNRDELRSILPEVIKVISNVHLVDISNTNGYGWITDKEGKFNTYEDFLVDFFKEDQVGFWKDWYSYFNSFLDKEEFFKLYDEMISLSNFSEKRYLVHGDFHLGNILYKDDLITGIIDWDNVMYGDYIYDIASLQMQLPDIDVVGLFLKHYKSIGIDITNFYERFKCASLCKGLDALRFFCKYRDKESYNSVLEYLRKL